MNENVVVVAGEGASPIGDNLLHHGGSVVFPTGELEHMLSVKNYGNFLPEVWEYMKSIATSPLVLLPSPLATALRERDWAVISTTIDGCYKNSGVQTVVETRGSIFEAKCLRCNAVGPLTLLDYKSLEDEGVNGFSCTNCGKPRVRPNVTLLGEKIFHKRLAEDFIKDSVMVVFLGVDPTCEAVRRWRSLASYTVFVSEDEEPTGAFDKVLNMTPEDWALQDCPLD